MNIPDLLARQRAYFDTGVTRSLAFRMDALQKLRHALETHEQQLFDAMKADLNKAPMETYMCEIGMVLDEIRFHLGHLPRWMKNKPVPTPLAQFPAKSFQSPEPYGVSLIMSPWNYPIQLCLSPLVGAISGGNCAVIKPSAYTPATSAALSALLADTFEPGYIAVVEGGRAETGALLEQQFDYIFFTGSVAVGKVVMAAAAQHLTPVTLELGGKSPVIVDETADLKVAARRIAFGKVLNAGQTCVEPDYLLIHHSVQEAFIQAFGAALQEFFPHGDYSAMPNIINQHHYQRLKGLLEGQHIALGGQTDDARRFIAPTLLSGVSPDAPVMQEEVFGPILPILTYDALDEVIAFVRARPKPLAFYLFTKERSTERRLLDSCAFGGVGSAGMGSYHGKQSFDTFTHYRSIVKKATWLDLPLRYHPYTDSKLRMVRKFMK